MNKPSYVNGVSDKPLIYYTIGEALDRAADQHGEKEAIVSAHQNWRISYRELAAAADTIAGNFLKLGLRSGDRVGIWSHNNMEWSLVQYATAKAGLILVTINPAYQKSELAYALQKVGCRALVLADGYKTSDYHNILRELIPELDNNIADRLHSENFPELDFIIGLGPNLPEGFLPFDKLQKPLSIDSEQQLKEVKALLQPDDPINIQFTSGTTGAPKGATLTHFNILNNGYFTALAQRLSPDDIICIPVPLYHCFGMVLGNLACLTSGATAVFPSEGFEPAEVLRAALNEKCTALYGVPAMFTALLEHPDFQSGEFKYLRTGIMAGAPCPIELMKRVIKDFGMTEVTIGYGMTETSPLSFQSSVDDPLELRVSTVGRIHPHVEVRIADSNGYTVQRGKNGEILTRGYSVMLGYWDDEAKTDEAIDDRGWMHTGDLGTLDDDGYCRIVGRIKDMIIRGGENIYPAEIEDFLYTHPDIQEVAVFGLPDKNLGESVAAWIISRTGTELSADDIRGFCQGFIAHYKIPTHIVFVDDFPRTVTGKIQKFVMRDQTKIQ